MGAREEILARVRSATADVTTESRLDATSRRSEGRVPAGRRNPSEETVELFAENVADYEATVVRVPADAVAEAIVEQLRSLGRRSVVAPSGLDAGWVDALRGEFEVVAETDATSAQALDVIDAVVTAAAVGIATTGTIVLDHAPDQGRRALTLVPDTHVCVIREDQIEHDVPEAVTRLHAEAAHARPLTWISGPSATSDIELQRVEGVHGPRTLVVVIAGA